MSSISLMQCRLVILLCCVWLVHGYRYLLAPAQFKSHMNEHIFVGRGLIRLGHDVHMVVGNSCPWVSSVEAASIKPVVFGSYRSGYRSNIHTGEYHKQFSKYQEQFSGSDFAFNVAEYSSRVVYEDCVAMMDDVPFLDEVRKLKIDLIVVDAFVPTQCNAILPYFLDIKFASMYGGIIDAGALPNLPSFVPARLSLHSDQMTFTERLKNLVSYVGMKYFLPFSGAHNLSLLNSYPNSKGQYASSWKELVSNSVLMIRTSNHILDWPSPSMPHYIFLPGITLQPAKQLPSDLDEYMAASKQGVVLVSFGSVVEKHNEMRMEKLVTAFQENPSLGFILKAQAHLKGRLPQSVKLVEWVPQNDILGHKNLKIFITHCGNNGQYESVYHGVPMIGLPQFAEQHQNCHRMHVKGLGICMDADTFTGKELADNIREILEQPSYKKNIQRLSMILKEDTLPMDKAALWLQHVTEYGGEHLRSSAVDMPVYQYWMLDVVLFFLICSLSSLIVMACCFCKIYRCVTKKSKVKDE